MFPCPKSLRLRLRLGAKHYRLRTDLFKKNVFQISNSVSTRQTITQWESFYGSHSRESLLLMVCVRFKLPLWARSWCRACPSCSMQRLRVHNTCYTWKWKRKARHEWLSGGSWVPHFAEFICCSIPLQHSRFERSWAGSKLLLSTSSNILVLESPSPLLYP